MRPLFPLAAGILLLLSLQSQAEIAFNYGSQCKEQNAAARAVLTSVIQVLVANEVIPPKMTPALTGGIFFDERAEGSIAGKIACQDRPAALAAYVQAFNGPAGKDVAWQNGNHTMFGKVRAVNDYHNGAFMCRDFKEEGFIAGSKYARAGTACRHMDGNWHFD
jgi:surface antigen